MAYSIATLKQDLAAVIHGSTTNKIENLDGLIDRAARKLLADCDPIETVRITQLDNAIYDQVFDYTAPSDLKGDRVIDIRPQVNRTVRDRFFQLYQEEFDMTKADLPRTVTGAPQFTIQYDTAVKSLRIAKNLLPGVLVNPASDTTGQGTWVAVATAQNLEQDTLNYVSGGGSLRFDLAAGANPSTGYLENSTFDAVDLSDYEDVGALFCYVYIPDPDIITNFILRWGSSSANYWSKTVTTAQNSTAFQVGWNLLRFDWDSATETGSPDATAVDYLRFTVTYDGTAETDLRLNNITAKLGSIYEIIYYSKFLFRDATTGTFAENVAADTDLINLDTDSYNLLFNLVSYYAAQQVQGSDSPFDATFFLTQYTEDLGRYKAKYKSQIIKPTQSYYSMPRRRVWFTRQGY